MLLSDITKKSKTLYKYQGSPKLVIPNQYLGVEIELEGCHPLFKYSAEFYNYWAVKDDGSLRSEAGLLGLEYVFKDALFGEDVIQALSIMETTMNQMNPKPSWRCGLHVHVDTSDLTTETLFNYIFLYMLYEKALYNYVGGDRQNSPFCVPLTSYTDSTTNLIELLRLIHSDSYGTEEKQLKIYKAFEHWSKYTGMNLVPLVRFGTIEFRQAPSMYNSKSILEWINILLSLKAAAVNIDSQFTKEFHRYISAAGLPQLSRTVFGDRLDSLMYANFYDDLRTNIKFVQHVLVSMNKDAIALKIKKTAPKLGLREKMEKLTDVSDKVLKKTSRLGDRMAWDVGPHGLFVDEPE